MVQDHNNPLAVTLPYQFGSPDDFPTEVLASRFQAWRSIIKDLLAYLKEYSSVQEEIVRQQLRLQQAVGISAKSIGVSSHSHSSSSKDVVVSEINRFFLPVGNGSIQDIPTILTKYHQQNVSNSSKTLKELNNVIIPKLEELRKDLLVKIKEIRNLQNDFKNNLGKEIAETKNLLSHYHQAIEFSNKLEHGSGSSFPSDSNDQFKYDPYLVRIKLERQLKKQLNEENYLFQAYENLQKSGGKLESIIVLEIQNYLTSFLNLINDEHSTIPSYLLPNFRNGFLSKESTFEWDSFIAKNIPSPAISVSAVGNSSSSIKNGTFIDLSFGPRKFSDLIISNFNSALNISVREGNLERRSKFLKNYSSGWYVLTCNFLHEFKTKDRKKDQVPVLSIPLDSCAVSEHSKDDGKSSGTYKFVLYSKAANGLIHRSHNWVFRTDTYQKMIDWYNDIKALTSLATPAARARYLNKKLKLDTHLNPNLVQVSNKLSRTSTALSNGTAARSMTSQSTKIRNSLKPSETNRSKADTSNNRLSSTFSERENHSPSMINQLINSDGTIITPVELYDEKRHQDNGSPLSHNRSMMSGPTSSQQVPPQITKTGPNGQPVQPIPQYVPNFQQGFYISPSQNGVQQFYDPVQQQYYTISQQPPQGPQPQYFPAAPQPGQPIGQGSPTTTHAPFFINNNGYYGQFAPQLVQPGQQPSTQSGQPQFGGQLPYPTQNGDVPEAFLNTKPEGEHTENDATTIKTEDTSKDKPQEAQEPDNTIEEDVSNLTITESAK